MANLTAIRAVFEGLMVESASIERLDEVSDGAGGWTEAYSVVGTSIVRRTDLKAISRTEGEIAARSASPAPVRLSFPVGTDVRLEDRITIDSQVYEVTYLVPETEEELTRAVIAFTVNT